MESLRSALWSFSHPMLHYTAAAPISHGTHIILKEFPVDSMLGGHDVDLERVFPLGGYNLQ
eukprot:scaffold12543_cov68-Skeletonema_dohrnii-CCMP3373.AAC.2